MKRVISLFGLSGFIAWLLLGVSRKIFNSLDRREIAYLIKLFRIHGMEFQQDNRTWSVWKCHKFNNDFTFRLRKKSSDAHVFTQTFFKLEYKPIIDLILSQSFQVNTIVDCGSNIGATVLFFKLHFPTANVITVEPDPGNYAALLDTINRNKLTNVSSFNKGIWYKTTKLSVSNGFRDGKNWSFEVKEDPMGAIEATTINDLIREAEWETIDLLKIDIEGSERYLFREGRQEFVQVLKMTKFIAIEVHPEFNCVEDIHQLLKENSFIFFSSDESLFGVNTRLTLDALISPDLTSRK